MTSVNKKILHIVNGEFFSGAEKVQHIIGKRLSKNGYEIMFATLFDGDFEKICKGNKYKIMHFKMQSKFDILVAFKIARFIKKHNYKLIHVHTVRTLIIGLIASCICGIPIIEHVHSPVQRESKNIFKNFFNFLISRILQLFVNKIICVSNSLKFNLINTGVASKKIITVHNGVSIKRKIQIKKLINNQVVVGMVALFRERKGVEVLLNSLKGIKNIKCRLIGQFESTQYKNKIKKLVEELKLKDTVCFTGFIEDMQKEYQKINILALPSLFGEGVPMVALEAMSYGIPVVGTDVEGVPELIDSENIGLICEPASSEDFRKKLTYLVENKNRIYQIGESALNHQQKKFSDISMCNKIEEVYLDLLN